ncbi:hypothetical protein [Clostridium sp. CF012]|uniref:hypothetical protein n=1 Tax=Clostridium sp. CF012 TaxID=2843319 RepID=UPI001C0B044B|nr:hypothetical protein [Clostridium sp. CF012]MBU3144605.1 hypothetical protein [Clostridium sp. CF012]
MDNKDVLEIVVLFKDGKYKRVNSMESFKDLFDNRESEDEKSDVAIKTEKRLAEMFTSHRYSMYTRKILINIAAIMLASAENEFNASFNINSIIGRISSVAVITKQTVSDKLYRAMHLKSWDYHRKIMDYLDNSEETDDTLEQHLVKNANNVYDKELISDYFNGKFFDVMGNK